MLTFIKSLKVKGIEYWDERNVSAIIYIGIIQYILHKFLIKVINAKLHLLSS